MKYFGSILDFTHQRNEDLMRVFRLKILEADFIVMTDIFEQVANSPASRFWVSEERAAIVMSDMFKGKCIDRMRPNKREMFEEIFKRVSALRKENPEKSLFELTSIVVNSPAPKFYLTPRSAGELIYRIKNGWYD